MGITVVLLPVQVCTNKEKLQTLMPPSQIREVRKLILVFWGLTRLEFTGRIIKLQEEDRFYLNVSIDTNSTYLVLLFSIMLPRFRVVLAIPSHFRVPKGSAKTGKSCHSYANTKSHKQGDQLKEDRDPKLKKSPNDFAAIFLEASRQPEQGIPSS